MPQRELRPQASANPFIERDESFGRLIAGYFSISIKQNGFDGRRAQARALHGQKCQFIGGIKRPELQIELQAIGDDRFRA